MSGSMLFEPVNLLGAFALLRDGEPMLATPPESDVSCVLVFTSEEAANRARATCPELAGADHLEPLGDPHDAIMSARELGLGLMVDLHRDERGEHGYVLVLPEDQPLGQDRHAPHARLLIGS
jgi:hypothetical protein